MPKHHRQPEPIDIAEVGAAPLQQSIPSISTTSSTIHSVSSERGKRNRVFYNSDSDDNSHDEVSFDSDEFGSDGNDLEDGNGSMLEEVNPTARHSSKKTAQHRFEKPDEESEDEESWNDEELQEDDLELEEEEAENITVDFGVFDMGPHHVDAVIHLIDQFCPDKLNEVDRDDFAAALIESPYTSIVKMNEGQAEQEDEEEEEEVCGLCSVIHFYNCLSRHPSAFGALEKLLKETVWRTAAPGIPPLDLLCTHKDGFTKAPTPSASQRHDMKALFWIFEMIQTVPMELTLQLMSDLVTRLEEDAEDRRALSPSRKKLKKEILSSSLNADPVEEREAAESFPCLFVLLAKVQRAVSLEPTTASGSAKDRSRSTAKQGKKSSKGPRASGDAPELEEANQFAVTDYTFWREEDEVLFGLRDQRVAVMVYRCRPQYEGQAEQEIPLSLMFAVQSTAIQQAAEEIKKRALAPSSVTRFR